VLGDSGGPMRAQAAAMAGDPFATMNLNPAVGAE
jgi:hypothetical protein